MLRLEEDGLTVVQNLIRTGAGAFLEHVTVPAVEAQRVWGVCGVCVRHCRLTGADGDALRHTGAQQMQELHLDLPHTIQHLIAGNRVYAGLSTCSEVAEHLNGVRCAAQIRINPEQTVSAGVFAVPQVSAESRWVFSSSQRCFHAGDDAAQILNGPQDLCALLLGVLETLQLQISVRLQQRLHRRPQESRWAWRTWRSLWPWTALRPLRPHLSTSSFRSLNARLPDWPDHPHWTHRTRETQNTGWSLESRNTSVAQISIRTLRSWKSYQSQHAGISHLTWFSFSTLLSFQALVPRCALHTLHTSRSSVSW